MTALAYTSMGSDDMPRAGWRPRRRPRRYSHPELDPGAPATMWFHLTAAPDRHHALSARAAAFCAEFTNARVVTVDPPAAARSGGLYVAIDGGTLHDVVRGGEGATAAVRTAYELVRRLVAFEPVLVTDPTPDDPSLEAR